MHIFRVVSLLVLLVVTLEVSTVYTGEQQRASVQSPNGIPTGTLSNINNISMWLRDDGWSARTPTSGNAGFTFPRRTAQAVFQDGWLWGGNVNDGGSVLLRVGGQTYNIGTKSGRIISPGIPQPSTDPDVRIYRVRNDYLTADLTADAADIFEVPIGFVNDMMRDSVRRLYTFDWNNWPWQKGAPFYDLNGNGTKDPGEDPGLAGADQVVWFVANDLDTARVRQLYGSPSIGLEMQVTVWAYGATNAPWPGTIFKRMRLIYKGTSTTPPNATITDMYLTQWSDPDVGDSGNDFAGCDSTLGLTFGYNATATDPAYAAFGLTPPAVGYKILQGPIVNGAPTDSAIFDFRRIRGKKNLPVSSIIYFAAGGTYSDPPFTYQGTTQWYNLMKGLTPITGGTFIHPRVPGVPTKFWLDGNPLTLTGRIDGVIDSPGDRRIAASCGPFTMARGDTQEVVVAIIAAIGTNNLVPITSIKSYAATIQSRYNLLLPNITGIEELVGETPSSFSLEQNYPNPFNPATNIRFTLNNSAHTTLHVYDLLGRIVATLVDEKLQSGSYSVPWNASAVSSGVYFYRLESGAASQTRKLILLR